MKIFDHRGREAVLEVRENSVETRALALVDAYQAELKDMKTRENGFGLNQLVGGVGFDAGFLGNGNTLDTSATWSLNTGYGLVTLNRQLLNYSYSKNELIRKVINQPVEDAFRGGVLLKSAELDPEEQIQLNREFAMKRTRRSWKNTELNDANISAGLDLSVSDEQANVEGNIWTRLFGGAGVIANTNQDFDKPMRVDLIGPDTPLQFIAANRWELILSGMNVFDERYPCPYSYYGYPLHRSRVYKMIGALAPDMVRRQLMSWGLSILEGSIRAINSFLKFEALLFELLDEAKIDVYRIMNFNTMLGTATGTDQLRRRVAMANQMKNFSNALIMDKNDEYDQKTMGTFKGLADIWDRLASNLCAYVNFPKTKLFGDTASGFGSGKDSMDTYNASVQVVRKTASPGLLETAGLRCQQLFGYIPDDLDVEFEPLNVLNGVEQEQVKTSIQARQVDLYDRGLYSDQEVSEALHKNDLLDVESAVFKGEKEAEPPMTMNPDEMASQQEHDIAMVKAKPAPAAGPAGKKGAK